MKGLTLEEVIEYQRTHPPVKHVYGRWGNLKKQYLIDTGRDWLIEDLPTYLHGIDKAAEQIWEVMREKLLKRPEYQKTGDFMHDVKIETEIKNRIEEINSLIENIFFKITGVKNLKIVFENSLGLGNFDEELINKTMLDKFKKNYQQELMLGNTLTGPHRDDFKFMLNESDMKLFASQGQQRLAIIAFKIAELYIFKKIKKSYPVLLLDDIFSEIDIKKRNKIIKYLNSDIQTIITTTDIVDISEELINKARIFKIKNGKITIRGEINGRRKSTRKL